LEKDHAFVKSGRAIIDEKPELLHMGKYPVIQQAKNGDPKPDYYVSGTPRATGPIYLQNSYVDASEVSYGALDGKLKSLGFNPGDYGLAIRPDQSLQSAFYFVDIGGNTFALGECSRKVGKSLGGSGRASHFNDNFPVSFIVFPESFEIDPREGTPAISDDQLKKALKPLLLDLSRADNANELPLLMAFNESLPAGRPQGKRKLDAFRKDPTSAQVRPSYHNIVGALRSWGYIYQPPFWPMM